MCNGRLGASGRSVEPLSGTQLTKEDAMEKDAVCGMQVDPTKAAGTSVYNGKTYYFCSKACKAKFDANPRQYAK